MWASCRGIVFGSFVLILVVTVSGCGSSMQGAAAQDVMRDSTGAASAETLSSQRAFLERLDNDGDGVPDAIDECAATPMGHAVNLYGCSIPITFTLRAPFAPQSMADSAPGQDPRADDAVVELAGPHGATRQPPAVRRLLAERIARLLREEPFTTAYLAGHTHDSGDRAADWAKAAREAEQLRDDLAAAGAPLSRIVTAGYGGDRPLAPNDTAAGQARNRRVEIHVTGVRAARGAKAGAVASVARQDSSATVGGRAAPLGAGKAAEGVREGGARAVASTASKVVAAPSPESVAEAVASDDASRGSVANPLGMLRFAAGSAELGEAHHRVLEAVAQAFQSASGSVIHVAGHADASGDPHQNARLARERALAVREALVRRFGFDATQVMAAGFGASKPIADNASAAGRRANRRVEIAIVSNGSSIVRTASGSDRAIEVRTTRASAMQSRTHPAPAHAESLQPSRARHGQRSGEAGGAGVSQGEVGAARSTSALATAPARVSDAEESGTTAPTPSPAPTTFRSAGGASISPAAAAPARAPAAS